MRWLKAPGDAVRKGEPHRRDRDRQGHRGDRGAGIGILRERDRAGGRRGAGGPDHRADRGAGRGEAADRAAAGRRSRRAAWSPRRPRRRGGRGQGVAAGAEDRRAARRRPRQVKTASGKIEKADVLAHVESRRPAPATARPRGGRAPRRRVTEGAAPGRRARPRYRGRSAARARAAPSSPADVPAAAPLAPRRRGARGEPRRRRRQRLAHHGRAHDRELDHRAPLLPGARGQREPPRRLARAGEQADRRPHHLHRSARASSSPRPSRSTRA